jgi:hypothetical protein
VLPYILLEVVVCIFPYLLISNICGYLHRVYSYIRSQKKLVVNPSQTTKRDEEDVEALE